MQTALNSVHCVARGYTFTVKVIYYYYNFYFTTYLFNCSANYFCVNLDGCNSLIFFIFCSASGNYVLGAATFG